MPTFFSVKALIRSFFRSVFWSVNTGLAVYTLVVYYLLYRLPVEHWSASMLMLSLPVTWVFHLLFIGGWAVNRSAKIVLSLLIMLAGFWLWPRTLALHWGKQKTTEGAKPLSVFSYNVMGFNVSDRDKRDTAKIRAMTDWVIGLDADVKCFQEFQSHENRPPLNMVERFRQAGYRYQILMNPGHYDYPGTALFSRYPILDSGREAFGREMNGLVWADLNVGRKRIRVICIHLQSMGIRVGRVIRQDEMAGVRHETKGILGALKSGFIDRREQLAIVEKYISESPYPVIVTGDFNETPYSVVYTLMRQRLSNAFEEAGHGFGFTLNRSPRYIRIDNQFFAPGIEVLDFQTLRSIPYSDHYPIMGSYAVPQD
ncbi:endonuclease/exonuclease/phosphatase family protein [Arsenicibacter rosenii]|uniref:Endonuclease n=1 Tax=Arsenicibacter rosenii TaxID=1750698 RepID=A0A1S2VLR9_9BACT|nr:endonuclease/exonuclease/phosphatase family protein [Arsenicibacter rosenii]OIN59703.1 endonuclease [Arsenicibacter rosenii]